MLSNEGFVRMNCVVLWKMRFSWSPQDTASQLCSPLEFRELFSSRFFWRRPGLEGEYALSVLPGNKESLTSYLFKRDSLVWFYNVNRVGRDLQNDMFTREQNQMNQSVAVAFSLWSVWAVTPLFPKHFIALHRWKLCPLHGWDRKPREIR